LGGKHLRWVRNLKKNGGRKILRRALELKFKGKRPVGKTRTGWLSPVLEVIKK
jgi:hypothetical protein